MGRPSWFRHRLDALGECYLLAVPAHTQLRDLQADPPPYSGMGRQPKRPWTDVKAWAVGRDKGDWTGVDLRGGANGRVNLMEVVLNDHRLKPMESGGGLKVLTPAKAGYSSTSKSSSGRGSKWCSR